MRPTRLWEKPNPPQRLRKEQPDGALSDLSSTMKMAVTSSGPQGTLPDPDFNQTVTFCRRSFVKNALQKTMMDASNRRRDHQRDAQKTPQEMGSDAGQGAPESFIEDFW